MSTNKDKDQYLLSRNYNSSLRLNLQHHLWTTRLSYLLHPSIPLPSHFPLKIADVGTGTGIWISSLAAQLGEGKGVVGKGFDVSDVQFPHPRGLPGNVELGVMDAMTLPPEGEWGVYDVVHVRLLMAVVEGGDPGVVLNHCLKLLKPGGWLQWDEIDAACFYVLGKEKGEESALGELVGMWRGMQDMSWIPRLSEIFKENGLESVIKEEYVEFEWQRHQVTEMWCVMADEYGDALERLGQADKAERVRGLARRAYGEIREGFYVPHTFRVAVGRKAAKI